MNKILIVEENFRLAERLCRLFSDTWMLAQSCATLEAAAALIEAEAYQLIIVDTDLPDKNGHDIVYELGLGQRNTPQAAGDTYHARQQDLGAVESKRSGDCGPHHEAV